MLLRSLAILALTPLAPAQELLLEVAGAQPGSEHGFRVAGVGDLDGDGVPDLCVGAPREDGPASGAGAARVYSGADGSLLFETRGDGLLDMLGWSVAGIGDVDLDGVPDVAVGARGGPANQNPVGYVRVISGATGTAFYTVSMGVGVWYELVVAAAGDVNGDGRADLIVGDRGADCASTDSGRVHVLSGASGSVLHVLCGVSSFDEFGAAVAGIGDLDGDGKDDFAVGAPNADGGASFSGVVTVHSGADAGVLLTLPGALAFERRGGRLDGVGDVDGDGLPDLVVANQRGQVFLYSGTGAQLRSLRGLDPMARAEVAGLGDVDGDGVPDVGLGFLASRFEGVASGSLWTWSGASGELLFVVAGPPGSAFGSALDAAGDVDGDGLADVLVGGPYSFLDPEPGLARAISGGAAPIARECAALANSTGAPARLVVAGTGSVSANDLALGAGPIPSFQTALFFYGPGAAQLPFGDGFLCVGGGFFRLTPAVGEQFRQVYRSVDLTAPPANAGAGAIAPGSTWRFQCWYRDPAAGGAGFNLTDAVAVSFLP